MTSTTKHHNDDSIGKCANKENESTNGKRSELSTKSSSGIDSNFDWTQKQAIHQQRKLRLVEVRQQSKEIASQIRENVRHEEQRQLERINRIKQDELINWRQKQLKTTEKDYKHCLSQIGQAHLAAERENVKQRQIDEQHQKNRQIALKRGKLAADKIKADSKMKSTAPTRPVKAKAVVDHSKKVAFQTLPETLSSSDSSSTTTTPTSSSSNSSTPSVIHVEPKKKPEMKIKAIVPVPSIKSSTSQKAANKSPIKLREYNPSRYASENNSSATDVSMSDSPMMDTPPLITKVSDLLGKKSPKSNGLRSSPYIAKTYKLDKTPVSSRHPVKKPTTKPQINSVSSRLSRAIQTPTKSSGKSPVKMLPERKHFVPEFVKTKPKEMGTKKDTSVQTIPKTSSKVQFYDHANKFLSEYESNLDLEERLLNVTPLNAWDEAKHAKRTDMLKKNEQHNLRMLAENRARIALEKEKIRKDYEKMSSQLSEILNNNELANSFVQNNELLSESRLKQIAEEREQLMNKEFRDVLKAPVVITCPKQDSTAKSASASTKHRPKSGEINVAQNKANTTPESNDVSTESTHSFLLDCMTERTNTICEDINRCRRENNEKTQPKIQALHDLLNQVNAFRRVLCDEIKVKNGNLSQIDASQFLTEIEKVEAKQHKIMHDKPAQKTDIQKQAAEMREQEFKERERLLKIKESCINDKARELYLLEKKIDQQKKQTGKTAPKSIIKNNRETNAAKPLAIVTANGADHTDDNIPVRIVINVNKNEHGHEKCTDVVVNDVKWRDKLAKSNTQNGHIESVPVTNEMRKSYPKTPAKTKVIMEQRQLDVLSQSSTSITAYLSPPDQIRTPLSNAISKRPNAISNGHTPAQRDNNNDGQINDSELLRYIVRMLGMSRTSIQQLNMSSVSSVRTPNSSVINVSDNRQFASSSTTSTPIVPSIPSSIDQIQSLDPVKLQQLARYLAENNQLTSNASQNNKNGGLSGIWDDILSKKTDPTSRSEPTDNEHSKSTKRAVATHPDDSDEKLSRNDLIAKYDELAANCTKRIINLDSMISKVREEKQKLLENTLSSASSLITGQKETTTEYKNYAPPEQNQQQQCTGANNMGSPLSDSKGTHAPSSDFSSTSGTAETSMRNENRADGLSAANKNKPFAESKDSGVGNSRPVTSSDYRDSPDLKQTAKPTEQDNGSKLLQNALRESKRDAHFEPMLKDLPKIDYQIQNEDEASGKQCDPNALMFGRDKMVKQTPPVAMARFSPHLEDELPHELSTITEVDTPATSRLNATDMTNISEATLKNGSVKLVPSEADVQNLQYKAFPTFKDYLKSNQNISASGSIEETIDLTVGGNTIPDERLSKMLEPQGSRADELKYKPFVGEDPNIGHLLPGPSEPHLQYRKFPSHAEYAKDTPGLLDSQSIDQLQNSDDNDNSSSSLPDIVSELKNRKILEHSFQEAAGDGCDFDDLLVVPGTVRSGQTTVTRKDDESLSDTLENELNSMGLKWVTASLKKMKLLSSSTSTSATTSDSSNIQDKLHHSKQSPQAMKRTTKRTYQNMNDSQKAGDSFVDKNLVAAPLGSNDGSAAQLHASNNEGIGKQINLKEFMARELLKHSSVSSSSDSSLASMFLKSFLGQSVANAPGTPPNTTGAEKHRTSTPIDSKDNSNSKGGIRSSSSPMESKVDAASRTFFPNDSGALSSVRFSTSSTSTYSDDRHK